MTIDNSNATATSDKPAQLQPPTTRAGKPQKPEKPYPEFPLTAHPAGYWCKKIRGKLHYFGRWDDPDAALAQYLAEKDSLHAGRTPRADTQALTVKDLCNQFLNAKKEAVDAAELSPRTWTGYKEICDLLIDQFGKNRLVSDLAPDDFAALRNKVAQRCGPHRLGTTIQCVRCVFKYAHEVGLTGETVRYGPGFKRPSAKTMRLHRAKSGPKLVSAEELRRLIDAAGVPLRAMLLLAANCGFGNSDVGNLPLTALDLDAGWIDFPRPKTGIARRCPLWGETVQAIRDALAKRPEPKNPADAALVFVTKYGLPWAKDVADSPVTKETAKLLRKLGITGRKGLGFYTIRHVFRTVADEAKDQPAADHLMGHESAHMSSVYRERISDHRLKAVSDYVRGWLFADQGDAQTSAPGGEAE